MNNNLTKNGISTTTTPDTLAYEHCVFFGNRRIQWDYRNKDGRLFSGMSKTLPEVREKASRVGYDASVSQTIGYTKDWE